MKTNYLWKGLLIAISINYGCRQTDEGIAKPEETYLTDSQIERMIKLGKKLENPYSVTNMKRAWANLTNSDAAARNFADDLDITTTHYYVKFDPKTEAELGILKLDSTLILFDYPLDVEREEGGFFYHDPSLPTTRPTYQYASVKVDYQFPDGVDYEILEELFIPDENYDGEDNNFVRRTSSAVISTLVTEALRITNNLDENDNAREMALCNNGTFRPGGRMTVYDPSLSTSVPVHDLEIRATRWFTTYMDKTNSLGYYSVNGTFERPCDYSLKWEKYNFSIRAGGAGVAQDYNNNECKDWNRNFGNNYLNSTIVKGEHQYHAIIFRAARQYYYGDNAGLRRPPENGEFKVQLKIDALYQSKGNICDGIGCFESGGRIKFLDPPTLEIANFLQSSSDAYSTTIHELAHASHWDMSRWHFENNMQSIVIESWATGVEKTLTLMIYTDYTRTPGRGKYTGVVSDLMDGSGLEKRSNGYYQGGEFIFSNLDYVDNVGGYSLREIEDALKEKRTWSEWQQS